MKTVGKAVTALFTVIIGVIVTVAIVIIARTLTFGSAVLSLQPCRPSDADYITVQGKPLERFQAAIRYKTISWDIGNQEYDQLAKFTDFIAQAFPHIHSSSFVRREVVGNYSLLYSVTGSQPDLQPYMLTAHLDVVPADPTNWQHATFDATIDDGFVYGRGTIDDKHCVMGILEALEFMLSINVQPKRSFYIGLGHDEEIYGYDGARQIGKLLESRGVNLLFLLDEGLTITDGIVPGISVPIALVGTSEKGWLSVKLSVNVSGGHSSMPAAESSIGILANAVARLEKYPQPGQFGYGDEIATFEHITHVMPFGLRMAVSNLWLFSPLISRVMSAKPTTNAIVRTTTAVTKFNAGIKNNVIATYAEALVNHRIHPAQTIKQVLDYDAWVIDDPRVKIEDTEGFEASPRSPHDEDSFGYQMIKTSIRQVWDGIGIAVAPGLMIGNTDTRWYLGLTKNIYRFSPTYMYPADTARFHGDNERISVDNYEKIINFFYHVMRNSDLESLPHHHSHSVEL